MHINVLTNKIVSIPTNILTLCAVHFHSIEEFDTLTSYAGWESQAVTKSHGILKILSKNFHFWDDTNDFNKFRVSNKKATSKNKKKC